MTSGEIREAIEESLGVVAFETLSIEYLEAVRDALRARLPAGAVLDVYHRYAELIVRATVVDEEYTVRLALI